MNTIKWKSKNILVKKINEIRMAYMITPQEIREILISIAGDLAVEEIKEKKGTNGKSKTMSMRRNAHHVNNYR
ncbi:MAG: hypothetical protein PHV98_00820 [Candidatus Omnitrophica bacterium]|nr:hypothetical protein [Candidatus Omnitrophota bacterium]